MKSLTRRTVLRGMAAAPVAGRAAAGEIASRLAGLGIPLPQRAGLIQEQAAKGVKFWSFSSWFSRGGERAIRAEAMRVYRLDPDIACLNSAALQHKVKMQQKRNYAHELAERKDWFHRTLLSNKFVEWWP